MQLLHTQPIVGSSPTITTKFCKCQQENVMLSRFLRRTETVEGDGFNSQPLGRVVSVTETNWTGTQVISIVLEVRLGGR